MIILLTQNLLKYVNITMINEILMGAIEVMHDTANFASYDYIESFSIVKSNENYRNYEFTHS